MKATGMKKEILEHKNESSNTHHSGGSQPVARVSFVPVISRAAPRSPLQHIVAAL